MSDNQNAPLEEKLNEFEEALSAHQKNLRKLTEEIQIHRLRFKATHQDNEGSKETSS